MDSIELSKSSVDELIQKKDKISKHCINLECQKEQLKILIEKLQTISMDTSNESIQPFASNLKKLSSKKSMIENELQIAKKQSHDIKNIILGLKDKIAGIDSAISCKNNGNI